MTPLTPATQITVVPSSLGEHQFLGADHFARAIHVDMAAGTLGVCAGRAAGHVFAWFVPNVPLRALNSLLQALVTPVHDALPGASFAADGPAGFTLRLTEEAERHLAEGDRLVNAFYRRWTGRDVPTLRISRCTGCGQDIVQGSSRYGGHWVGLHGKNRRCSETAVHEPTPFGQPHQPHRYIPDHLLDLVQDAAGAWSGTCSCGSWRSPAPSRDWTATGDAHFLHAEAIPPGAPFGPNRALAATA